MILIIKLDGIGDVVMTGPFLRELRRGRPDAHITLVVSRIAADLVELCPHVDQVLRIQPQPMTRWWHPLSQRAATLSFARRHLWPERYELAIVPRWGIDLYEATLLAFLSGALQRAGFSEHSSERRRRQNTGYDRFLTDAVADRTVKHEVQRNLGLLTRLDVSVSDDSLDIWVSEEDELIAKEMVVSSDSGPLFALAPGAGSDRRKWPIERFVEVGRWLIDRGGRVVVVGGPGEERLGAELRRYLGERVIDLTNRATLRQTAVVLRYCSLFCGNDAGPMHLAAAVNVPVVEISCHPVGGDDLHANSPERFGPWGVQQRIVRPEFPRPGCSAGCRGTTAHCILDVRTTSVISAIESLMEDVTSSGDPIHVS